MAISYRLRSSMDIRPDEGLNEKPKRIIFLSVEGSITEKNYFDGIQKYRECLNIKGVVHIETLSRGRDTKSDIDSVYNLLQEYMQIREEGILPEDIRSILIETGKIASPLLIKQYLKSELPEEESKALEEALDLAGVDIGYQKYLSHFKGEDDDDIFAVVIDRDQGNHSVRGLEKLFQNCQKKGSYCFITNPCFEFWLLLHVCDVKKEYESCLQALLDNKKVSDKHTYVSSELSRRAGHTKRISDKKFATVYLPNIDTAILRAKDFEQKEEGLIHNLGSNLPQLFELIRK